jgi:uncharacterized lipoprotein
MIFQGRPKLLSLNILRIRSRKPGVKTTNLLPQVPDIKIGREGTYRWLIVDRSVEDIWPVITEFWMAKGFLIADQSPITGIVETDWAEDTSKSSPSRLQAFMEKFSLGYLQILREINFGHVLSGYQLVEQKFL